MKKLLWMTAAMALAVSAASAQQFWDKKPYENWSKEECKRMLEHSPWAERWDDAEVVFAPVNRQTELGTDATRQVNYVVQFRSALPMRRAVVRMAFLQATKGHRAKPEEQQRFRQQSAGFLSASFDEFVVLHVLYGSNIPEIDRSLAVY